MDCLPLAKDLTRQSGASEAGEGRGSRPLGDPGRGGDFSTSGCVVWPNAP